MSAGDNDATLGEREWELAIFDCLAAGSDAQPKACRIAGWVKEPFAIDRRWFFDPAVEHENTGWMVTHLPTGFCCFGIVGGKELALQVVDELRDNGCWDFVDPIAAKNNSKFVRALRARYPEISGPSYFKSPLWLDGEE